MRRSPRRVRTLPLPLLIPLAAIMVIAGRMRAGRRGPLAVAAALFLCVAIGGFGARLAARPAPTPTPALAAALPPTATIAATATTAAPTATTQPSATATATRAQPTATSTRTAIPTAMAALQNVSAPVPVAATDTPTVVPPTVPPTPRGTTVIPILMYHYVRVVTDKSDTVGINLSVTPANFAAQMKYLADKGYTTLTMREVYAILAGEKPMPPNPIALTFDDGYRDFYTAAWPVLRQYGFKATNYVFTNVIDTELYLTWPMIRELDASGLIEIGAHTRSHSDLRALGNDRRWNEIAGSKAILEEGLGHPVTAFCYPAGFYNAAVIADVRRAGYLTATTTAYGSKLNIQSAFELPRVRVNGPDPLATWVSKLP